MLIQKWMATCLAIGSGLAIGCQSNNNTAEPQQNSPVVLKAEQSARVGENVTVSAIDIEDSRCPANAVCIWYGQAKVKFALDNGNKQQNGDLCIGDCGQGLKNTDTTTVQLGGTTYKVILSEVRPYPGTSTPETKPEAVLQLIH